MTGRWSRDPDARVTLINPSCSPSPTPGAHRFTAHQVTGPGGQRGNDSDSSATGSQPQHRHFGQATPGPVLISLNPPSPRFLTREP